MTAHFFIRRLRVFYTHNNKIKHIFSLLIYYIILIIKHFFSLKLIGIFHYSSILSASIIVVASILSRKTLRIPINTIVGLKY